jgi:hypothetical protein
MLTVVPTQTGGIRPEVQLFFNESATNDMLLQQMESNCALGLFSCGQ